MNCKCGGKSISDGGKCRQCFIHYVEQTVIETITQNYMIKKNDKVAVAVSGGKDSLTVLYILHKLGFSVTAITIDEGIAGYRSETISDSEKFCNSYGILFKVYSFKKEFGFTLDEKYKNGSACLTCGVLRRYLLNKAAKDFDVIVTGHNLDDEVQSILMNFLKGNLSLAASLGPVSGVGRGLFTQRVKPLYFIPEKEVKMYSFLLGFEVSYNECPYASESFRFSVRDAVNSTFSRKEKVNLVNNFLTMLPKIKQNVPVTAPRVCNNCNEISRNELCRACLLLKNSKNHKRSMSCSATKNLQKSL